MVFHTVPEGGVRLFGVPESGKDIFSLYISPKLEIKLNQNPLSSCTSTNWRKPMAAWSCILLLKYFFNMTCMDEKNQKVTSGHKKKS